MRTHSTSQSRDLTSRFAWIVAATALIAVVTAFAAPWNWGFALTYVATAFVLQTLVRPKNETAERLAHLIVLSGSAGFAVRFYFGTDLSLVAVVHIAAVLACSIGVGYLLADRVRPGGGPNRP